MTTHAGILSQTDKDVLSDSNVVLYISIYLYIVINVGCLFAFPYYIYMGMDQYLLIPLLGGWTSIYQLFWCSPGVQGFDTLPYIYIYTNQLTTARTKLFSRNVVAQLGSGPDLWQGQLSASGIRHPQSKIAIHIMGLVPSGKRTVSYWKWP